MDISFILNPISGAIIGYFTNYIAIKMLFKPYTEKYIFGIKVPFTPGVIPKEKIRISKSLGEAIGTELLNEQVISSTLMKVEIKEQIKTITENYINSLKIRNCTLNEFLCSITNTNSETITNNISKAILSAANEIFSDRYFKEYMAKKVSISITNILKKDICSFNSSEKINSAIKDIIISISKNNSFKKEISSFSEKILWESLIKLRYDSRQLNTILSPSTQLEIKDYISLKVPDISNAIISLTENEEIENMLKSKIQSIIQSTAGPFMGMFIKSDDIYVKIIESVTEYVNNEENMPEIEKAVSLAADKFFNMTLGELSTSISSQLRESTINKAVLFITDELISENNINILLEKWTQFFEEQKHQSILDILKKYDLDIENKLCEIIYNSILDFNLPESIDLSNKITTFTNKLTSKPISQLILRLNENHISSISTFVTSIYEKCVINAAPALIEAFGMSSVVEEKINSLSMEHTEKIILEIANKELKAITLFGGVLGFIIGFVISLTSVI